MIHSQAHVACDSQLIHTSISHKHAIRKLIARGAVSSVLAFSLAAFPVAGAYAQDNDSSDSKAYTLQSQSELSSELSSLMSGMCQELLEANAEASSALRYLKSDASPDLAALLSASLKSSDATDIVWGVLSGSMDAAAAQSALNTLANSVGASSNSVQAALTIVSCVYGPIELDVKQPEKPTTQTPESSQPAAKPTKPATTTPAKPTNSSKPSSSAQKTQSSASSSKSESSQTSAKKKQTAKKSTQTKKTAQAKKTNQAKKSAADKYVAAKKAAEKKAAERAKARAQAAAKKKAAEKKKAEAERQAARSVPNSGEYHPKRYAENLSTQKFVSLIGESARQLAHDHDLYASVLIAQAILESGSGNSELSKAPNFNLFGIKGAWHGKSVTMRTQEDDGTGRRFTISSGFRTYDSVVDSMVDYAKLLDGDFYRGAHKSVAKKPAAVCDFLQGRYATDTSYSHQLQDLIKTYDLTRFDSELKYETKEAYKLPMHNALGGVVLDKKGKVTYERRDLTDVLNVAIAQLGTEYVWGAETPKDGFDCSGLVQYSYKAGLGVNLPRVAEDQAKVGKTVKFKDLQPGDLLFFAKKKTGYVYHVALYLGDGCYLHAPDKGDVVKVTSMEEFMPSFAKRPVETVPVKPKKAKHAKVEQKKEEPKEFTPKPIEVVVVQPGQDLNEVIAQVKAGKRG